MNTENHVIQLISYKALEEMVQDETIEARNVTLRLASDHSGFRQRLSQNDLDGGTLCCFNALTFIAISFKTLRVLVL